MAKYIEREALLSATKEFRWHEGLKTILRRLPAADVAPVRMGRWVKADEQPYFRKHYHTKICSECGKRKDGKWNYCPICGAKMEEAE